MLSQYLLDQGSATLGNGTLAICVQESYWWKYWAPTCARLPVHFYINLILNIAGGAKWSVCHSVIGHGGGIDL